MIPNTKENKTILLNLSKSAIHADDTNLAKASTSGACNLIFPFKKNKLRAYWRLVTQVYPIFPLKKNKLGAYWWLVTQVYPTYLRLNYIILHKNIRTSNLLAAMYVSNILKFLNPIFKQVNQRLISTSSCHSFPLTAKPICFSRTKKSKLPTGWVGGK